MTFFGKYPIIFWGTPESIGGWATANSALMSSCPDPFGVASGYARTVTDSDNAASPGYIESTVTGLAGRTYRDFYFMLRKGSVFATSGVLWFRDTTANATRRSIRINWGTSTLTSLSGDATRDICIPVTGYDDGGNPATWLLIRVRVTNITPGNTNKWRFAPAAATENDGTLTGSAALYRVPVVISRFPFRNQKAAGNPKKGYEVVRAPAIEDVWETGFDYFLRGEMRWIPGEETLATDPYAATGYDGRHPYVATDPGLRKFLEYAWGAGAGAAWSGGTDRKNTFRLVPDRTDLTTYFDCYLQEPVTEEDIQLESNGERWFPFLFRNAVDGTPFEGF